MHLENYALERGEDFRTYAFFSEGPKEKIEKLIQFSLVEGNNVFNLVYGDCDPDSGEIDDMIVTDNDDSEKVFATVVAAVYSFCEKFPDAWVYTTGSTASRTRLYHMGINKYFDIVKNDFIIYVITQNGWERYIKSNNYQAFVIQ